MLLMALPGAPHVPVMRERIAELLATAPPGLYVDLTLGAAGHAAAVLARRRLVHGGAELLGVDRDPAALLLARTRLAALPEDTAITLEEARFDAIGALLDARPDATYAAGLMDLGISSMHVDEADRGFSYRQEGPLDMRMGPDAPRTAADVVNTYDARELARVLTVFGEERHAMRIARAIVSARPLHTTTELADVVVKAIPAAARRRGGHPATRTFQALRIEVNGELDALAAALPMMLDRLAVGGVLAVLAYHSLEDRLVKRAFGACTRRVEPPPGVPVREADLPTPSFELVTNRAERPSADEARDNRRATAARLRAIRRVRPDDA